jgi:hypothetical protein
MDIGVVERGVVVRVDGEGKIVISHDGLTPVEVMGLLAMAQVYVMHDLRLIEEKQQADDALLDALRKAKAG